MEFKGLGGALNIQNVGAADIESTSLPWCHRVEFHITRDAFRIRIKVYEPDHKKVHRYMQLRNVYVVSGGRVVKAFELESKLHV